MNTITNFNLNELKQTNKDFRNYIIIEIRDYWDNYKDCNMNDELINNDNNEEYKYQLKQTLKSYIHDCSQGIFSGFFHFTIYNYQVIDFFNKHSDEILEFIASDYLIDIDFNLTKFHKDKEINSLHDLKYWYSILYIETIIFDCISYMESFVY